MNIVVLQDYLRSGGTERQSILLADGFATKGHATTLLTFRPGGKLAPTLQHPIHKALQPLDLRVDWLAPGLLLRLRRLRPDIVLCMGRMANCYGGHIQKRLPRAAVVATMRTGKSLPFAFRNSLRLVRHIVANSKEAAGNLVHLHGVSASSITVIPNALVFPPSSLDRESAPVIELRTRHGAGRDTFVLVCVAMFRPEKKQRELIEIVASLPRDADWQLWLAGDGPALRECEELAAERGLSEHVRFLGWQANPRELYAASDVAVHASESEALSNFLIEAQAHGLPAVAYDAQGNSECLLPGRTGFIIPKGDRRAFADAVVALSRTDPLARAERSKAASAFARESFNHHRQIQAYISLFRDLAPR